MRHNYLLVKKSVIQGRGVFSKKYFCKGETICFMPGREISLFEMIDLVDSDKDCEGDALQIGNELYLDLDELPRSFNHNCSPNSFVRSKNKLVALRDIHCGEEIFFDYSTTMADNEKLINPTGGLWTCKCKCGSSNCRGIIDQFKTLPKKKRDYYLSNKFVPNFILRKFKE